eukprot:TRINITY_DN15552_c0_g1_i1.p1 TRINITY_DN15552_c0_g1~~TRINITY_DN15552_c0_g1_i1.p1  ORF type:complete len:116 (-),score=15.69 TRINITY_DN15552_c0_g1_i1:457-804(-)
MSVIHARDQRKPLSMVQFTQGDEPKRIDEGSGERTPSPRKFIDEFHLQNKATFQLTSSFPNSPQHELSILDLSNIKGLVIEEECPVFNPFYELESISNIYKQQYAFVSKSQEPKL